MNIRLFSVVLSAVGSLALAACTVTTTDGSGGAGGGGGDTSGSMSGSTASSGMGGAGGTGGGGGTGGVGGCTPCGVAITDNNVSMLCAPSQPLYDSLKACACDATKCGTATACGDPAMCEPYAAGMAPTADCVMCIQMNCSNEFNSCANDL